MVPLNERYQKLQDTFASLKTQECGPPPILIAQVDPDAIGAAFGLRALLFQLDLEVGPILYGGAIAHPQNRTIVNRFNLSKEMHPIGGWKPAEPSVQQTVVLVDSSEMDDNRLCLTRPMKPVVVIDHHRGKVPAEEENTMFWVEDVGAASTLVGELLLNFASEALDDAPHLALLLAMGIYTDTKSLISSGPRDQAIYNQLSAYFSNEEMKQLIDYPLPAQHYQHLAYALNHMTHHGPRVVSSLGRLDPEDADDISTVCDYLIRMDGISLTLTWGLIGEEVRISARSTNLSMPLDEFLRKRFGPQSGAKVSPDGRSEGGARIAIDLGFWMGEETQDAILSLISTKIQTAFFDSEPVASPSSPA